MRELTAERTVVRCRRDLQQPARGPWQELPGERLRIDAFVGLPDGSEWVRDQLEGDSAEPTLLGAELAKRLLDTGARELLDRAEARHDRSEQTT